MKVATVHISASGAGWKALKADIDAYLVGRGFRRIRSGDYVAPAQLTLVHVELIAQIYGLEGSYGPKTFIKELGITQSPNINVRIRRRMFRGCPV